MAVSDEAATLIAKHGARAQQVVVDEIVAAIRRKDDAAAAARGVVLRAIDEALRKLR